MLHNMIALFFVLTFVASSDIAKTDANALFDKTYKLSKPAKFNENPYINHFDNTKKADALIGQIYSELKKILSHYFVFFSDNAPDFNIWYKSKDLEMDDETKAKILNYLNSNVKSKDDLSSFWLLTQGSYLQGRTADITSNIRKLQNLLNLQSPLFNHSEEFQLYFAVPPEKRNTWLMNKAIFIIENFKAGIKNYEDNRYTDVLKNFLTAVVEKKKLDMLFGNLVLSL